MLVRWRATCSALIALLAGCGGGPSGHSQKVDWDVSRSHTMADVRWYDPSIDQVQVRPVGALRIRLSGGREFRMENGPIEYVYLGRYDSDQLDDIEVHSQNLSYDDAYRLALRWCREWRLPTDGIEDWHANVGVPDEPIDAYGGSNCEDPGQRIGRERPSIGVEVLERDVNVALVVFAMNWHSDEFLADAIREAAQARARKPSSSERRLIVQAVKSSKLTAALPPDSYDLRNIRKATVRTPGSRYARLTLVPRPGRASGKAAGIVRLQRGRWRLIDFGSAGFGSDVGCGLPRPVRKEIGAGLC